jgi:hypothetical protein
VDSFTEGQTYEFKGVLAQFQQHTSPKMIGKNFLISENLLMQLFYARLRDNS